MALAERSGNEGNLSVPVAFNDDGDLTEDLDQLRAGIDESLEVPIFSSGPCRLPSSQFVLQRT